jgi:hypothetical protein
MKSKIMWAVKFKNHYFTYATKDMVLDAYDLIEYRQGFKFNSKTTYVCRVEVKEITKKPTGRKKK